MSVAVLLDIFVSVLLVITIVYAFILNRKLTNLRNGTSHMEKVVKDFYQATTRAESSLTALREVAGNGGADLAHQVDKMVQLRDELAFLVERADSQGAQLERLIREGRDAAGAAPADQRRDTAPASHPDADLDAELFGPPAETASTGPQAVQEVR